LTQRQPKRLSQRPEVSSEPSRLIRTINPQHRGHVLRESSNHLKGFIDILSFRLRQITVLPCVPETSCSHAYTKRHPTAHIRLQPLAHTSIGLQSFPTCQAIRTGRPFHFTPWIGSVHRAAPVITGDWCN
jgi:hypothetical protein